MKVIVTGMMSFMRRWETRKRTEMEQRNLFEEHLTANKYYP